MDRFSLRRFLQNIPFGLQAVIVVGVILLVVTAVQLGRSTPAASTPSPTPVPPTPTFSASGTLAPTSLPTSTPSPSSLSAQPTPTLLAPEGGIVYALQPYVNRVGWVASGQETNHFGESHLYTGSYGDRLYHGAFQIDLSFLSPGSQIHYAAVELTGQPDQEHIGPGQWSLQMLGPDIDPEWPLHGFSQIHQASVAHTLSPVLESGDLAEGATYVFELNAGQRAELEQRIARGVVSFRLDGPSSGGNSLFSWDSGHGNQTSGRGPVLRLAVAQPPPQVTPVAQRIQGIGAPTATFVVITSVPTPRNILTAAADALAATAWATAVGTPTPVPINWVTPIVVTATPTPGSAATATARAMEAKAAALLTGTPTPMPDNVWTATPTPTFVVVTPVPTPENLRTVAAQSLTATAWAVVTGTATPLPDNWVTPIIVVATPTPGNRATASAREAEATAAAFLTGTPTPTPINLWVVTPTRTPLFIYLWDLPPSESGTSTPTPALLPSALRGRIGFISNRRGAPATYMMDTDGNRVALLSSPWAYQFSLPLQTPGPNGTGFLSEDGRWIVYDDGEEGERQVWVASTDGTTRWNVSSNEFDEHGAIWLRNPPIPPTSTPTPPPTAPPTSTPPPPPPPPPPPTATKSLPGV